MASLTTIRPLSELEALRQPRDDLLVLERTSGDEPGAATADGSPGRATPTLYSFDAEDGPFGHYRRHATTTSGGPGTEMILERIDFKLCVPYFGPAFALIVRRSLRTGVSGRAPWWSPPRRLDARSARVLGAGCALAVVVGFLGGLVTHTMTFIVADLGGTLADQTRVLALTRIGALATLAVGFFGDRLGRRPLIRGALLVAAASSMATAAATSLAWVAIAQTVSRGMVAGGGVLVAILVIEEMPAAARAYAIGLLALSGGLGVGMVLWVLPVTDLGPGGWRLIYLLSALFAVLTVDAVRRMPESRRFDRLHRERATPRSAASPFHRISPRRITLLALIFVLLNVFVGPAQQLQNEYLRSARGYRGVDITAFLLLTNTWGFIGVLLGGRMADRRSRHLVASVGLLGLGLANAAMFSVGGWRMWVFSALGSIVGAATTPALGVLGPELFPTGRRGLANTLITVAAVAGSVIGLQLATPLIGRYGYGTTFALLALAPISIIALLGMLPETAREELEVINDEVLPTAPAGEAPQDPDDRGISSPR